MLRKAFGVLALLVVPSATQAEETADPCALAKELAQQILDLQETTLVLLEDAKPICARKRESHWAADECSRRMVEIDGFRRQIKEVTAEREAAKKACAAKS